MTYATVEFPQHRKTGENKINRKEPNTVYASIDITKTGQILMEEENHDKEDNEIWGYVPDEFLRNEPE